MGMDAPAGTVPRPRGTARHHRTVNRAPGIKRSLRRTSPGQPSVSWLHATVLNLRLRDVPAAVCVANPKLACGQSLLICGIAADNLAGPSIKPVGLSSESRHLPAKTEKDRCGDQRARDDDCGATTHAMPWARAGRPSVNAWPLNVSARSLPPIAAGVESTHGGEADRLMAAAVQCRSPTQAFLN